MSQLVTMMVATKHANDVVSTKKRQRDERNMRADKRQLLRNMTQNDRDEIAELEQELKISKVAFLMRYRSLEEKYGKLESENAELKSQNAELKSQNSELKSQNAELKSQNAELKSQNPEFQQLNDQLHKEKRQLKQLKVQYSEVKNENIKLKKLDQQTKARDEITFNVLVPLIYIVGPYMALSCTKEFLTRQGPTNLEPSRTIRIDEMSHPVIRAFRHQFKSTKNRNFQLEFDNRLTALDLNGVLA